jgi:hypothetical protein
MTDLNGYPYDLMSGDGLDTLVAYNPGDDNPVYGPINSLHPNFDKILVGVKAGDPDVWELFNIVDSVMNRFVAISERYSWNGRDILFDGDPLRGPLSELLTRCLETGDTENLTAVAKFGENLAQNPNEHSREQAFGWLARYRFQITSEGYVVGYKGVTQDDGDSTLYLSTWSSAVAGKPSGFVNGVPVRPLSRVPQRVGDHVTLPRSEVKHNPDVLCDRGLHVSTINYARSYGNTLVVVLVNPRDIVSVPGHGEKMRTCGYTFVSVESSRVPDASTTPILSGADVSGWQGDVGYRV